MTCPRRDRDIAMIFQSYALYPQMNVAQNIGFALKMKKVPKAEIARRVKSAANVLGISDWLDRKPTQLSGGQRQRVAMGRAIVREPNAFLMDEPLSNLDAKLRVQMRAEIARVQKRIGVAALYVTHDQTEAMTLGHRVAVLRSGVLQQCDAPQVLYDRPTNLFVAGFIGSPAMNLFEGSLNSDLTEVALGSQKLTLNSDVTNLHPGLKRFGVNRSLLVFDPKTCARQAMIDLASCSWEKLRWLKHLAQNFLFHFTNDAPMVRAEDSNTATGSKSTDEESVELALDCVARIEPRYTVRQGDTFKFSIDPVRLEFFDSESGSAIWG